MSLKCEQQLEEEHAVQLLMGNIDDRMVPSILMYGLNHNIPGATGPGGKVR